MLNRTVKAGGKLVVVSRATTLIGLRRTRLIIEASGTIDHDPDLMIARRVLYPAMIAAVTAHEGFTVWPIPFEEFIELDETFAGEWERAVFELNPHWLGTEDADAEKKIPPP